MATTTYEPIQTQTLSSATNTVTLNSFSGYTDLKLVMTAKTSDSSGYFQIFPNNDTGSNYSRTLVQGNGSSATSNRNSNSSNGLQMNCATSSQDINSYPVIVDFMNYSNTTTAKTAIVRAGSVSVGLVEAYAWLYRPTSNAAVTSLVIKANTTTFTVGSTFTLYGIANAQIEATKATGGTITYDNTYFYHTFGASGTFTPQQSLTADVLLIAGGGGGGRQMAGGGGAGGYRGFASQSLTTTAYTITVGAGGAGAVSGSAGVKGGNSSVAGSGFTTITSTGGGRGQSNDGTTSTGGNGGSGGGGAGSGAGARLTAGTGNEGSYSPVEGFDGGAGFNGGVYGGGGGGGAAAVGSAGTSSTGGAGGAGSSSYSSYGLVTGTGQNVSGTVYYAGGGGGGSESGGGGAAGLGGGGAGSGSTNGSAGLANTGGGGGG